MIRLLYFGCIYNLKHNENVELPNHYLIEPELMDKYDKDKIYEIFLYLKAKNKQPFNHFEEFAREY
jgi:cytochrome c oxidase assembly protein Cox11